MKGNIISVVMLLLAGTLTAQTKVSGIVTDVKGEPVPGANILLLNTYDGSTSDAEGRFSFTTSVQGVQTLVVKFIGFKEFRQVLSYILKPVDKDELKAALQKFKSWQGTTGHSEVASNINRVVQLLTKKYKERFVIKVGEHLRTIDTTEILFFYSAEKATFCTTKDNRNYILDFTLDQLEMMLNPDDFFRINRKYIVRSAALKDIISHTNSRLKLTLKGSDDNDIIVARERVQAFRNWLDR
ncbi:MAG: LytTR family transcriptional regulator DNA-binding domain-containing protein [Cyclobacteriaceae bacterium]